MRDMFQTVLLRLALCGLAASVVLLVLRSRLVRDAFARLMSAWRSLTAFGRVAVCSFLLIGILIGGDKTNSVPPNMNLPLPQMVGGGIIQGGAASCRAGDLRNGSFIWRGGTPHLLGTLPNSGFAEWKSSTWNVCGAWKDSFWLPFGEDWVFPHGSNHLSGVEVVSYGEVWATPFGDAVASLGVPVEIVPGLSAFGYEHTPSNSYRFAWTDAAINRDTNTLVTASIELFRNGDTRVTTNGVAAHLPRELPFDHHGFGQDDEWVAANFTNATEILAVGYPQWVDAQVGTGLTNGLYKLTVAVACDPPETTQISVGNLSIAVTNAGEYVFLLEKGPDYDFAVFPPSSNVTMYAVDDIAATRGVAFRSFGNGGDGTWTPDGGEFRTDYVAGMGYARLWWLPWLCGSPDVTHIDANAGAVEFHANLVDYRREQPMLHWTASDGLTVASPNLQTTQVSADGAVAWARASMTVTASFGDDRSIESYLNVSYGTERDPPVSCELAVQDVHFINEGGRPERVYPVSVSIICPIETNGVVDVSYEGDDGALFWYDADAIQPRQSLSRISLSSVGDGDGGATYTFYMTSPRVGGGSFTASFTLADGDTRTAVKGYRAVEPIRRLITKDRDETSRWIMNLSRLVYDPDHAVFENTDAVLAVSANGPFSASEVRWSIVSGPGVIVSTNGWRSTVRATAATGTVVVEARFGDDALQPRFVLPIVTPRVIPVKVFVVSPPGDAIDRAWSDGEIEEQVGFANLIFRQVGIKFNLLSTTRNVGTANDWIIKPVWTIPILGIQALTGEFSNLLDTYSGHDCVEVYCIGKFLEFKAWGAHSRKGIALCKNSPSTVLAHELGHALGLGDCYVGKKNSQGIDIFLSNADSQIAADMFGSIATDWCAGSGRGFTESTYTRETAIMCLLMHGCAKEYARNGFDIPSGTVKALKENSSDGTDADYVAVGAEQIKLNDTEVYSR